MVKFECIDDKTDVSKQPGCALNFGFYLNFEIVSDFAIRISSVGDWRVGCVESSLTIYTSESRRSYRSQNDGY
jgi:hypothetical protein